jgi:hybrid cluster-associated redox disulfide protein
MAQEIRRDTPIGELVMNYPSAVAVLFERGFHCIGCSLSAYETLEEGARVHGMDDAGIDALVEELRKAAKDDIARIARLEKEIEETKAKMSKEGKSTIAPEVGASSFKAGIERRKEAKEAPSAGSEKTSAPKKAKPAKKK